MAKALGEKEVVDLLTLTLEEEKQTDLKLTEVTQQHIMPAAMGESETSDEPAGRKKPATARAKAA
jgi:ferritin-like metal-binding protein YciE